MALDGVVKSIIFVIHTEMISLGTLQSTLNDDAI